MVEIFLMRHWLVLKLFLFCLMTAQSLRSCQDLTTLPLPLLWKICHHLQPKDILALRCTCKSLANAAMDEAEFWPVDENGKKCKRAFPKLQTGRRQALMRRIRKSHPNVQRGALLLIANFEKDAERFVQESSFYYFTGINDAAVIMLIEFDQSIEKTTLFVPQFCLDQKTWTGASVEKYFSLCAELAIDEVVYLGKVDSYLADLLTDKSVFEPLVERLETIVKNGGKIFTLIPGEPEFNEHQRILLLRLEPIVKGLPDSLIDIFDEVGKMRRKKDITELTELCSAIDTTCAGFYGAAQVIGHGKSGSEVQAAFDSEIIKRGFIFAFSTMVQSGKYATILHCMDNNHTMVNKQLVLLDCGAKDHYQADLTRVFPVAGRFNERQLYLYNAVLATQDYVANHVKPGYWLSNKNQPDRSLRHLALNFLNEKYDGLGKYFIHGTSHYLGLDTHDVDGGTDPIEEGAVITIEPGVYLPDEKIGIRIEDDYLITRRGAICLSRDLPKAPHEIEAMMARK